MISYIVAMDKKHKANLRCNLVKIISHFVIFGVFNVDLHFLPLSARMAVSTAQ